MSCDWSAYELATEIDVKRTNRCEAIDELLHKKLENLIDISKISYYISNINPELFPKTKTVINNIVYNEVENGNNFSVIDEKWLNTNVCDAIAKKFLDGKIGRYSLRGIQKISDNIKLDLLKSLLVCYSQFKSQDVIHYIKKVYNHIDEKYLTECCEILNKASPAVSACMLSRNVDEKYIVCGLKSLSKLSKQRKVDTKIKFSALKNLGPRSRLDAIKQLLGLCDKYKNQQCDLLPFDPVPSKSEIEEFLFPCSLKYNEEVSNIINQYERLTNKTNKEVSNGKCI